MRLGKRRIDLQAAMVSGAVAGVAYLALTALEERLLPARVDDRVLLGGQVAKTEEGARKIGTVMHLGGSVGFGVAYAALAADRLSGPPWLRGTVFFNAENTLLYPMTAVPGVFKAIDDGRLDPYWSWPAYVQSVPRHVLYGVIVGAMYDRLRR